MFGKVLSATWQKKGKKNHRIVNSLNINNNAYELTFH